MAMSIQGPTTNVSDTREKYNSESNPTPTSNTEARTINLSDINEKDDPESNPIATSNSNDFAQYGPAPDGGLRAWLNAAGGFSIFFACLGFTSCFGVLQQYYSTHQLRDQSMDDIAWIGSLSTLIQFSGGVIGGPLFDRFGIWVCVYA